MDFRLNHENQIAWHCLLVMVDVLGLFLGAVGPWGGLGTALWAFVVVLRLVVDYFRVFRYIMLLRLGAVWRSRMK